MDKQIRNKMMVDDYNAGMLVKDISEKYNLSPNQIYAIFKKFDEYSRPLHRDKVAKNRYAERNQQIIADYKSGVSAIKLGEQYGISRARIYMIISGESDYQSQRDAGAFGPKRDEMEKRNAELIARAKEKPELPMSELIKGLNLSVGRGYEILHSAGIYRKGKRS